MNSLRSRHEETSNIRVLIANLTGIVAELIVQEIQSQPDLELLGTVSGWHDADVLMGHATIFVIGFEDEIFSSSACLERLNDYPQLKILMLRENSDEATIYWRVLHYQQMQVISTRTLIESIRHIRSPVYADMRQQSGTFERN
jgi:hypothetical protein